MAKPRWVDDAALTVAEGRTEDGARSAEARLDRRTARWVAWKVLDGILRLLHPFMPFISEEIWQTLPHHGDSIVTQPYPAPTSDWDSKETETEFDTVERFVNTARAGRALLNIQPGKPLALFGTGTDPGQRDTLLNRQSHAAHLSKGSITAGAKPDEWGARVLRLPAEGLIVGILVEKDIDLREALTRISKQKQEYSKECDRTEAKLSNSEFMAKAPEDVVVEWRQRLVTLKQELDLLASSERQLLEMMK